MENKKDAVPQVPRVIVFYELFIGFFETIGGLGMLIFGKNILRFYENIKNTELFEDPNDLIATFSEKIIPNLFKHHVYIALLLLLFGIIKLASGIGLIYKKLWAEHLLVIFLVILLPFEVVGVLHKFSISELAYLLLDVTIIAYLVKFKPVEYYNRLIKDLNKKIKEEILES